MDCRKSVLIIAALFWTSTAVGQDFDLSASIERGKSIYSNLCASCHMADGTGISGLYSPLVGVDSLMNDESRLVKSVLKGVKGPVEFNGIEYSGDMQSFNLSDREVADLLNYIRNAWGNEGEAILPEEIQPLLSEKSSGH